jgi:hypothetical protein
MYNNLNPVISHRDIINQNIAKGFVGTALLVMETPNNPIPGHRQFVADNIMKGHGGGEGSRGGRVIGHTKSGKAIYDTANHATHKDFTSADHADAITANRDEASHHNEMAEGYEDRAAKAAEKSQMRTYVVSRDMMEEHRAARNHHVEQGSIHKEMKEKLDVPKNVNKTDEIMKHWDKAMKEEQKEPGSEASSKHWGKFEDALTKHTGHLSEKKQNDIIERAGLMSGGSEGASSNPKKMREQVEAHIKKHVNDSDKVFGGESGVIRNVIKEHLDNGWSDAKIIKEHSGDDEEIKGHVKEHIAHVKKHTGLYNIKKSLDDDIELGQNAIFTPEAVTKFTDDLTKAFEAGKIGVDEIEKGMKDLSKLTKKTMTDKNGQQRTVYVLTNKPEHKEFNPNGIMQKKDITDEELAHVHEHRDKLSHINRVRFDKLHQPKEDRKFKEASAIHDKKMKESSKPPSDSMDEKKVERYKKFMTGHDDSALKTALTSNVPEQAEAAKRMSSDKKLPKNASSIKVEGDKVKDVFSKKPSFKAASGGHTHIISYSKPGMTGIKVEFKDEEKAKKFKKTMERSGYDVKHFKSKSENIKKGLYYELNPQEQDDIRKGEIMDKLGMGYGGGSNALVFTKTGKELKAILPVTVASLTAKKDALEITMATLKGEAGVEPTEVYQSYQIKSVACKRYNYELISTYDNSTNRNIQSTTEQKAMGQYNDACYAWQSLSEDIVACGVIAKNLEESKKYTLSVSQLIALQMGLISEII